MWGSDQSRSQGEGGGRCKPTPAALHPCAIPPSGWWNPAHITVLPKGHMPQRCLPMNRASPAGASPQGLLRLVCVLSRIESEG